MFLNRDLSGIQITDEVLTRTNTTALAIGHSTIIDDAITVRTAPAGGGTLLDRGLDYELAELDAGLTALAGVDIYIKLAVLNGAYHSMPLYITYKTAGDKLDAGIINNLAGQVNTNIVSAYTVGDEAIVNLSDTTAVIIPSGLKVGRRITVRRLNVYDGGRAQVNFPVSEPCTPEQLANISIYGTNCFFTFEKVSATRWEIIDGYDRWQTSAADVMRMPSGACKVKLNQTLSALATTTALGQLFSSGQQTGLSIPSAAGLKAGYDESISFASTASGAVRYATLSNPGSTSITSGYVITSPISATATGKLVITLSGRWYLEV